MDDEERMAYEYLDWATREQQCREEMRYMRARTGELARIRYAALAEGMRNCHGDQTTVAAAIGVNIKALQKSLSRGKRKYGSDGVL
jgi:hypothetical protein